ncbi:hypothetical protein ACX93W_14365 [Paenibacillus sp. CAU 1782]
MYGTTTVKHGERNHNEFYNELQLLPVVSPWEGLSEPSPQLHSCILYRRKSKLLRQAIQYIA